VLTYQLINYKILSNEILKIDIVTLDMKACIRLPTTLSIYTSISILDSRLISQ